jgi:hypothetical protein
MRSGGWRDEYDRFQSRGRGRLLGHAAREEARHRPGATVLVRNAPVPYREWLAPLPESVVFATRVGRSIDIAHLFLSDREVLARELAALRKSLRPVAALWISWPKKASKLPTTITEDVIRELALPMGWVDVKVCAVSEVWSGLKLVETRTKLVTKLAKLGHPRIETRTPMIHRRN